MKSGKMRRAVMAAAVLLAAAASAPAEAQRYGPLSALVNAICIPWTQGIDAKVMADTLGQRGIKAQWVGTRLTGFELPARPGFVYSFVQVDEKREWCGVEFTFEDSRVDQLAADVDAFAAQAAPGYRFQKAAPRSLDGGPVPRFTWAAPLAELSLDEHPPLEPLPGGEKYKEVYAYFHKLGG